MSENSKRKRARLISLAGERKDEASFLEAKAFLDAELTRGEDAELLRDYGLLYEHRGSQLIREALGWHERSLELDPSGENRSHRQLILCHRRLLQTREAIDLYKRRLADAPEDITSYRFLTQAYSSAGEHEEAVKVIAAGLALDARDPVLLEARGGLLEHQGHHEEALAAWLEVLEIDPDRSISPRYSRVFLFQRLGRLEEAAAEWEAIIAWLEDHDYRVQEWPRRELAELRRRIASRG